MRSDGLKYIIVLITFHRYHEETLNKESIVNSVTSVEYGEYVDKRWEEDGKTVTHPSAHILVKQIEK